MINNNGASIRRLSVRSLKNNRMRNLFAVLAIALTGILFTAVNAMASTAKRFRIPQSEFQQIFQRFYRGKEVEQQEGSGLGLYLAQLILQREKGYITVSSKVGEGSSFSLFLLNE